MEGAAPTEHAPRPTPLQASGAALSYRLAGGVATACLYFRKTIPQAHLPTPIVLEHPRAPLNTLSVSYWVYTRTHSQTECLSLVLF